MQCVFQPFERLFVTCRDGDEHGRHDTRQSSMHAGLQHADPQKGAEKEIGNGSRHSGPVEQQHARSRNQCKRQCAHVHVFGIEQRDDGDRTDVVDDGDGQQQRLQRDWYPAAQQSEETQRKGNIGSGGNGPAANIVRRTGVDGHEYQRRNDHAANRGKNRKRCLLPALQLTGHDLALHFQADQEEEQRHQAVVDPQQQWLVDRNEFARREIHRRGKQALIAGKER